MYATIVKNENAALCRKHIHLRKLVPGKLEVTVTAASSVTYYVLNNKRAKLLAVESILECVHSNVAFF
jgi:hypothetical protein